MGPCIQATTIAGKVNVVDTSSIIHIQSSPSSVFSIMAPNCYCSEFCPQGPRRILKSAEPRWFCSAPGNKKCQAQDGDKPITSQCDFRAELYILHCNTWIFSSKILVKGERFFNFLQVNFSYISFQPFCRFRRHLSVSVSLPRFHRYYITLQQDKR